MKSLVLTLMLVLLAGVTHLFAEGQSVGTSLSFFYPEKGYLSYQTGLSYTFGFGMINFPVGVNYNKLYGLSVENEPLARGAWFYADSLMPYALIELKVTLFNVVYFMIQGGGALNWNITLEPLKGNIDRDLAFAKGYDTLTSDFIYQNNMGYGYIAGAGVGVKIDKISVDISAAYENIISPLRLQGYYYYGKEGQATARSFYANDTINLLIRGYEFKLSFSYKL